MSNDKTGPTDCPTEIIPAVAPVPTRRSILHAPATAASAQPERGPFAGWRDAAQTEELPVAPAVSPDTGRPARAERAPSRRTALARHLRAALAGTLLAIVAISGISAYAAAGIADARQAAADHARSQVSVPR